MGGLNGLNVSMKMKKKKCLERLTSEVIQKTLIN